MANGITKNEMTNNSPKVELQIHIAFWVIYFFYPYLQFGDNTNFLFDYKEQFVDLLFEASIVYTFYLWLLPKYLSFSLKTKWGIPLMVLAFLFVLAYTNCSITHYLSECNCSLRICIFNKLLRFIFLSGIFSAFYLFKQVQKKKSEIERTKKEQYLAELESLKAQINPHFLFNTLNAIYSNSITKNLDSRHSDSILQFAELLKYTTYEGGQDTVVLSREIEQIENYIRLQKFRLENKVEVQFEQKNSSNEFSIAPLLLMTFVENAFKYTNDLEGFNHKIIIKTSIKAGIFSFFCQNSYKQDTDKLKVQKKGIGLSNTLRRLKLLYPNEHHINISDENNIFSVDLKIDLS